MLLAFDARRIHGLKGSTEHRRAVQWIAHIHIDIYIYIYNYIYIKYYQIMMFKKEAYTILHTDMSGYANSCNYGT